MKITFLRIISVVLLVLVMFTIFSLSAQPANDSSKTSGGTIDLILKVFYPPYKNMSAKEQKDLRSVLSFPIRKLAHFTLYFALGLAAFLSVFTYTEIKYRLRIIISGAICLVYSVSDEIHQYFVPGRACRFYDILIDCLGAFLAISVLSLVIRRNKNYVEKG